VGRKRNTKQTPRAEGLIYQDANPPRFWEVDKIVNIAMLDSE
jgi:hypothetical protein